ncbi:MAG: fumarate hydratase [Nitrososphaerota archaeon]|nr:lyase family protein [Nitrososphaerota archaeon]MCL5672316.1 lyase family protein [Nitrososphaerota archaeon]MDG6903942.1 fumarate hydratase [Nitrososphaerota archaeon]MDG6912729.1 fumarate hydratase [Nitrososphaerota archaeon]MDG6937555.1 fumarate hydratase [Nitrososphaerota archaeon]
MKYVEGSKRVFLSTGTRFPREVIWAIGAIKLSAAKSNAELGLLGGDVGKAIQSKARELMEGEHDQAMVVDVFQTGSGTGLNMNANEVLAELASAELGKEVHPNDHVNMGQSSNDVGPTAVRVAAAMAVERELVPALRGMSRSLEKTSRKTANVYKAGRTHLRDALPVTMGQEFGAYADEFSRDTRLVRETLRYLLELPIGGTAVGTGINTDPRFGGMVASEIARMSGIPFRSAKDKFRPTRLLTDMSSLSGAMRTVSIGLYRLCQDLRLMFSGPLTGLGEIDIPTQEEVAGSSIMPGKTNPVTVESALLASAEVAGLDSANAAAASLGEFELAMGVPLMGYNLVLQAKLLSEALRKVASLVIDHVVPMKSRAQGYAETSQALVTLVSPKIGYDKASALGKKIAKGTLIRPALKELGFSAKEIESVLDMKNLVKPGIPAKKI